jgi:hypothetical protein
MHSLGSYHPLLYELSLSLSTHLQAHSLSVSTDLQVLSLNQSTDVCSARPVHSAPLMKYCRMLVPEVLLSDAVQLGCR